jgi:hypothetical protein
MYRSKRYTDAALPFGYTSGCLVALTRVTDAVPIAAEEISIHYHHLVGEWLMNTHEFPQQVWRFQWLYHSSS